MNLGDISKFITDNGLAIFMIIIMGYWVGKLTTPYFKKRLDKSAENEGKLEDTIIRKYFDRMDETVKKSEQSNEKVMKQLDKINSTNEKISITNEELSRTNRKLVESYEGRFIGIESDLQYIKEKVK